MNHREEGSCSLGRFPVFLVAQIPMVSNSQRARIIIPLVFNFFFFFSGSQHYLLSQSLVPCFFLSDRNPYLSVATKAPAPGGIPAFQFPWHLRVLMEELYLLAVELRMTVLGKDLPSSSKRTDAAGMDLPAFISDILSRAAWGSACG